MIKELNIVNFQSHKSTELELAPGVNIIVGPSDSGKSAIIRALRWLIWNRPIGDAFISHWADGGFVNIILDDHTVIQRAKGPGGNEYRIDTEIFKAFSHDVPQPVQEILNLDETNLQRQGDSPFLISNSPGEVSAFFNKVAGLDKIDSSIKYITREAKSLKTQIDSDQVRLQSLETESERYQYLEQAEARLEILEEDHRKQKQRRIGRTLLQDTLTELYRTKENLDVEGKLCTLGDPVDELLEMHKERHQLLVSRKILRQQVFELRELEEDISQTLMHQILLKPVEQLLIQYKAREHVIDMIKSIKEKTHDVGILTIQLSNENTRLERLEEEFHKHMPEQCPLCGK